MSSHDRRRRLSSRDRERNRNKRSFEAAALQDVKVEKSYSPFSLLRGQTKRRNGLTSSSEAASGEGGAQRRERRSSSRQVFIKKEEIPSTSSPANIAAALQEEQSKLDIVDTDLHQLIKSRNPDLDLIGKKTSERRKVLRHIKRLKREGYRRESWVSRAASEVRNNIEKDSSTGSFIIDDIFKSLEATKEHFGRFGTIALCEDLKVDGSIRKVKFEYFNKSDASKALNAKHPKGINFYIDPFPENQTKNPAEISRPIKTEKQDESSPGPGNHMGRFSLPGPKPDQQNLRAERGHSLHLSARRTEGDPRQEEDRPSRSRKYCSRPEGHRPEAWSCTGCNFSNSGRELLGCRQCGRPRPGNWRCDKCQLANNTPDKLACFRRSCGAIRRGNWVCPDPSCKTLNWARSLQCYRDHCQQFKPGAWTCQGCKEINFKDNASCYRCQARSGNINNKSYNREFEIAAERAKQRQAFENIRKRKLAENSDGDKVSDPGPGALARPRPQCEEGGRDWGETFREIRSARARQLAQSNEKTAQVQNRLLALVGQSAAEPQLVDLAMEEEGEEVVEEEVRPSSSRNANLEPLGRSSAAASKQSKLEMRKRHVGLMDDELVERIQHGSEAEKQEILKKFNIIEIKTKPNNDIVEINLDDSNDGESDANNNNEDEDDDDDDDIQIIEGSSEDVVGDGDQVSPPVSEQEVPTEHVRVRGDLVSVNPQEEEEDDDDDEIVILEY